MELCSSSYLSSILNRPSSCWCTLLRAGHCHPLQPISWKSWAAWLTGCGDSAGMADTQIEDTMPVSLQGLPGWRGAPEAVQLLFLY